MPKQNGKTDLARMLPVSGICAASSGVIAMLLAALCTIFIENEYLNIDSVNILAIVVQLIATTVGVLIAGKIGKTNAFVQCIMTCGCYIALLLITAILFFDGVGELVLPNLLAVLAGGGIAIFLSTRRKIVVKRKKRRVRSR